MSGWQLIETAPKNETDILLIRRFGGSCYAPVVAAWFIDGWYSQQFPDTPYDQKFTHWMPLPPPPSQDHPNG